MNQAALHRSQNAVLVPFIQAGFTEIALVQIGGDTQEKFIAWAERELLPALRSL